MADKSDNKAPAAASKLLVVDHDVLGQYFKGSVVKAEEFTREEQGGERNLRRLIRLGAVHEASADEAKDARARRLLDDEIDPDEEDAPTGPFVAPVTATVVVPAPGTENVPPNSLAGGKPNVPLQQ